MIGMLYVVLTALLMIGGVLHQDGLVAAAVAAMVAGLGIWAIRSVIHRDE